MAAGLMRRYREAGKAPPKVLYVDRDCCAAGGKSSVHETYHDWRELVVRLDVWHLMRRWARGVTADGQPGYHGYHHVVALAQGLVELCHHTFVTVRQTREMVALWVRLTERDKAAVTFPPPPPGQAGQRSV